MNEKLLLMIAVPIAAVLLFWLAGNLSRKNNSSAETDHVAEAEVYLRYGERDKAIKALENGLKKKPGDAVIQKRLEEIKRA